MRARSLSSGLNQKRSGGDPQAWLVLLTRLPAVIARGLIRGYQLTLSPFIGNQCRFHPSCSNYAMEAVEIHGALKGSWLAIRRLGRCHPYHPGGFDPVPQCCEQSANTPRTLVPGAKEN